MLIEIDRGSLPLPYQKSLWGVHAGKVWAALRGGCSRQHSNPDTVFGMVLSRSESYTDSGVYIPFELYGRREQRWLNANPAMREDFEQHMVFAADAIWLWMVLGSCDKEYLIPKGDLFHLIPPSPNIMAWDRPWQDTAAIMCRSLCDAVARDEYAREV